MKLNSTERYKAVMEYKTGKGSQRSIAKKYNISTETLREILARYESEGEAGLEHSSKNRKYSKETKEKAVEEYLSGKASLLEICKKYKIKSKKILSQWIMWYNGHREFKEQSSGKGEIYMTKGRKTTQEERAEIVAFCIEHGKDYRLTVEKYRVSYQQIYSWVKKYEERGIDGLADGRGRTKPESEMSESEKMKAEKKILEAKIKDLEMENALLKKLEELERGRR